ncbi:MAG: 6-bladed beta-propeller [Balneolaceae bacterium]|nr:6-bladed beta-propeller [Balneolaceae bacterium]
MNKTLWLIIPFMLVMAGCSNPGMDRKSLPDPKIVDSLELFLSVENHPLNRPDFMEVLPDGRLAILDTKTNKVQIYKPDSELDRTFGGRGKGPGEFVAPRGLFVVDSVISVNDVAMMRFNQFNLDGSFLHNYITERASFFGTVSPGEPYEYYSVANGEQGNLIRYHNTKTDSAYYFGEALATNPPPTTDSEAFLKSAADGKVPDAIKNDLNLYYKNGSLYVFLKSYSRLHKYRNGQLDWEKTIELPVNRLIFENFTESVLESKNAFGILRYIHDMTINNKTVFLLWNAAGDYPQQIVRVNSEGRITGIYKLPEKKRFSFSSLAVDLDNSWIYLAVSPIGEVYRFNIP